MRVKIDKWRAYPGLVRHEIVHAGTAATVTAAELMERGWRSADMQYERGYISRRDKEPELGPVYMAGGSRRGNVYYLEPCYTSTNYCLRVYLVPGPDAEPLEIEEEGSK